MTEFDLIFKQTDEEGASVELEHHHHALDEARPYTIACGYDTDDVEEHFYYVFMSESDLIQLYNAIGKHLAEKEANK